MKLYTFYSENFLPLKKIFSKSLKDNFDVEYVLFDFDADKGKTGGGYNIWIFKTKLIIDLIRENLGEIIVFSDIDIQFFKKTEPIIRECLQNNDIVFQRENGLTKVNIGFIGLNCNSKVLGFWEEVLKIILEKKMWDQQVVNDLLLAENKLNWDYFPVSIWNWNLSQSWKSIVLHHSIGTGDLRLKQFQMRIVKYVYHLKLINNFEFTYKISRKIYRKYKNIRLRKFYLLFSL